MADRLGRILDPYPIAPSFDHFPSLNAPAPAPLASTLCRQRANVSVWSNLPYVASTGTIFERDPPPPLPPPQSAAISLRLHHSPLSRLASSTDRSRPLSSPPSPLLSCRVVPRPRLSCLRRRSEGTAASPHPSPSRRWRGKIPSIVIVLRSDDDASRHPPPPPL